MVRHDACFYIFVGRIMPRNSDTIIHHLKKGGHEIREYHFKGLDVLPARRGSHHKPYRVQPEIRGGSLQGLGRYERNSGRYHKA